MQSETPTYNAIIKTDRQNSQFRSLPNNCLYMKRTVEHPETSKMYIAYTEHWVIFIGDTRNAQVKIHTDTKTLTLPSFGVILVPPFSLINWEFGAGQLTYQMWYLSLPYPKNLPRQPSFVEVDAFTLENEYQKYLRLFEDPSLVKTSIALTKPPTLLASQVKRVMEQHFSRPTTIRTLLNEQDISHASGARAFFNSFGLPMQKYRMLLRMMRAQENLLIEHKSVTETGLNVGFNDLGQFYRNFQKFTSTQAKKYANSVIRPKKN